MAHKAAAAEDGWTGSLTRIEKGRLRDAVHHLNENVTGLQLYFDFVEDEDRVEFKQLARVTTRVS